MTVVLCFVSSNPMIPNCNPTTANYTPTIPYPDRQKPNAPHLNSHFFTKSGLIGYSRVLYRGSRWRETERERVQHFHFSQTWENLQKPLHLMVKTMLSCRFALNPLNFRVLKFPPRRGLGLSKSAIDAGRAARAPPPAPVLRMRTAAYAGGQVLPGGGIFPSISRCEQTVSIRVACKYIV